MADEKSDKGFSVVDRRIGTDEEESRQEEQKETESEGGGQTDAKERESGEDTSQGPGPAQSEDETPSPDSRASEEAGASAGAGGEGQVPPANFPSFLLSLHSAALIHLGLVPNPADNQVKVDLPIARYHIDLLEMLEKKTQGNLDEEEDKLIKNILYELRMAFLEVSKNQ
jgi:hypothetical protein